MLALLRPARWRSPSSWCSPCRRRRCCWRGSRPATTSTRIDGHRRAGAETVEEMRARLGLNRSIGAQYARLARPRRRTSISAARCSTTGRSPISSPSAPRTRRSWPLTALAVATLLGLPLGVVTGIAEERGGRRTDSIGVARAAFAAAASHVALPGVRRGTNGTAAGRRHDVEQRRRAAVAHGRARGRAGACRSSRCSSACSRRR